MADFAQIAYAYAQAEGLTAADVRAMTPSEFRVACGVSPPLPRRFREMHKTFRRQVVGRLQREERETRGTARAAAVETAVRSIGPAWNEATVEFVSADGAPVTPDGPAFIVRRGG